jgi:hypothetical protein
MLSIVGGENFDRGILALGVKCTFQSFLQNSIETEVHQIAPVNSFPMRASCKILDHKFSNLLKKIATFLIVPNNFTHNSSVNVATAADPATEEPGFESS